MDEEAPVRIKDLIQYLQTLDSEAVVALDKDGWMLNDCSNPSDPQAVIRERGLFNYFDKPRFAPESTCLIINN